MTQEDIETLLYECRAAAYSGPGGADIELLCRKLSETCILALRMANNLDSSIKKEPETIQDAVKGSLKLESVGHLSQYTALNIAMNMTKNQKIAMAHMLGVGRKQIAETFDISTQRVYQILQKEKSNPTFLEEIGFDIFDIEEES